MRLNTTTNLKTMLPIFLSAFLTCTTVFAMSDEDIQQSYQSAVNEFSDRKPDDLGSVDAALRTLAAVEGQAQDSDLNYRIYVLESRAFYYKGQHIKDKSTRLAMHAQGQDKANLAIKLDGSYSEAYYFAGINLARWAETTGVTESLGRKDELMSYMDKTMSHTTMDDQKGVTIDGYGPKRVLGKVFQKLPFFFGGSHSKAVECLEEAYKNAKSTALNVVYLAEILYAGNRTEQLRAMAVLDELLSQDKKTYNTSRQAETLEEFDEAKELRASMK